MRTTTILAPAGVRVRPATRADTLRLVELYRGEVEFHQRLARYYEMEPGFDWISMVRYRLGGRDRAVLVAEREGALIGFVYLRVTGYAPPGRVRRWARGLLFWRRRSPGLPIRPLNWGLIEDCFVAEPFRGQGVGEALVSGATAWFAQRAVRRVELSVLEANPDARKFWYRMGFESFRVTMWREGGHDPQLGAK